MSENSAAAIVSAELKAWLTLPEAQREGGQPEIFARLRQLPEGERLRLIRALFPLPSLMMYTMQFGSACLDSVEAHEVVALDILLLGDRSYAKFVTKYLLPVLGPPGVLDFLRRTLAQHPAEVGFAIYHVPYQFSYTQTKPFGDVPVRTAFQKLVEAAEQQGALEFDPVRCWGRHPRDM